MTPMDTTRTANLVAIANLVRQERARTRGDIAETLSMRATSVSEFVGELVARDVLRETMTRPHGRGRPAVALSFNRQRFGAIFISVTDRSLVAKAVDLGYRVFAETRIEPPQDCGNAEMGDHLQTLVATMADKFAPGIELCTIMLSLPGLLDVPRSTWCLSSRWPNLRDLDVVSALSSTLAPVRLVRNLDAELAGICAREDRSRHENALLLHWGYGVGAAFSTNGIVINHDRGRFCEIGHWSLGNGAGRQCTCGNSDCLETVTALWAIGAELREQVPMLPLDENGLADELQRLDIATAPVIEEALRQILRITGNLCRLLFPDRIILSGPFAQNPEIFRRFVDMIAQAPLLKSLDMARVSADGVGMESEITGALAEPFDHALMQLLSDVAVPRMAAT